jgi:hypothetical protein
VRARLVARTSKDKRHFAIEYDGPAGYYLYVFEGERDIFDYLQDTLELAKEQALEQFGVQKDEWRSADDA